MNIFKQQKPFTGIKQTDLAQAWQQNRETLNHISALFHVIIGGAKHKPKWQRGSKPKPHHTVGSRPCRNEPQPQAVPTIAIHRGANGISKKQLLNHTKHRPCQNVRHQPIET